MRNNNFWRFQGNEERYIKSILKSGFDKKKQSYNSLLEKKWSDFHNLKYSVTSNSCTSSLHAAFLAIGLGKGDEVLVPALTPIMCATTIAFTKATPVYVDSNEDTFLIDYKDIIKKITKDTKAILAVHMYSGICDLKKLKKICKKYKLYLIEDCAECVGAIDENGILAGTVGDISCWSFQSAKQLTCGDGGIASTNNKKLGKKLRQFSNLGFGVLTASSNPILISKDKRQNPNYDRFLEIGFNYRMSEFSAAVALAQTENLNKYVKLRRNMGLAFTKIFKNNNNFKIQLISDNAYSTYYTFAVYILKKNIQWVDFRSNFIQFGGDGIYAASKLLHQEIAIKKNNIGRCFKSCKGNCVDNCIGTPVATKLQKKLFLFTTNQKNRTEVNRQLHALKKTIKFFNLDTQ